MPSDTQRSGMSVEQVVRYVDLTPEQGHKLQIATTVKDGRPVEPMRIEAPRWLAISHAAEAAGTGSYILYFLAANGHWIDFAQRPTLQAAMDEVGAVVSNGEWRSCALVLGNDWNRIPRESIA